MLLDAGLALAAGAIFLAERRAPLRRRSQAEPSRTLRNLAMGALSMAVVAAVEGPLARRLARRAEERRQGLVQRLPLPPLARDAVAFLLMDYTIYVWHVLTHKVPALWRLHLVHHIDLDLDASTALRFHAVDMLVSVPWRAAQVAFLGVSPRAFRAWQGFFFLSVLFHHANLRLPERLERVLALVLTTPRMHGIHHSTVKAETNSNWTSGLSVWDRLHRTFCWDVAQRDLRIGVPAYRDPADLRLRPSLEMPFHPQRDAWRPRERHLQAGGPVRGRCNSGAAPGVPRRSSGSPPCPRPPS
ncbi:sterol desaturase family protein [Muricoccus aerilatus]|uniref:sterol desaturase family protein n=1 Tax=Muricoccus aerilatus TaxID=452982 RepID=UPI0009FDBD2D|nr:sterol desaturase family protein [Roseomonas aerilata]